MTASLRWPGAPCEWHDCRSDLDLPAACRPHHNHFELACGWCPFPHHSESVGLDSAKFTSPLRPRQGAGQVHAELDRGDVNVSGNHSPLHVTCTE